MRAALRFLPFLFVLPAASAPLVQAHFGQANPRAQTADITDDGKLSLWFATLRYSETAEEASKAEGEIFIRLTKSTSPTVNFLMESANAALGAENEAAAKAALNQVITLQPDFAEGLTRSAALDYQEGDLITAKSKLEKALRIEPRHFGAWSGLGLVLEDMGDLKGAKHAYQEALYFHPFLDSAKRGLIKIEARTDGLSL